MNPKAIETFSTFGVGALCVTLGVIAVAAALTALERLQAGRAKPETVALRGVLRKGTWATVHMGGAETFERVRFVGFTSNQNLKTNLPQDLTGMAILEDEAGTRFLVRAKAIRMIVVAPEAKPE